MLAALRAARGAAAAASQLLGCLPVAASAAGSNSKWGDETAPSGPQPPGGPSQLSDHHASISPQAAPALDRSRAICARLELPHNCLCIGGCGNAIDGGGGLLTASIQHRSLSGGGVQPDTQDAGAVDAAVGRGEGTGEKQDLRPGRQQQQQGRKRGPAETPSQQLPSAAELLTPLLQGKPFTVAQVPGRGRGLVATRPIPRGEVVHREGPLLAFPELGGTHGVCYHCLAPLAMSPSPVRRPGAGGRRFCCDACLVAALEQYLAVEEAAAAAAAAAAKVGGGDPLAELYERCRTQGERFPLMAARLAFMEASEAVRQHLYGTGQATGQTATAGARWDLGASTAGTGVADATATASAAATATGAATAPEVVARGDPLRSLHVLCFANVAAPFPEPWVEQHRLLTAALGALATDPAALRNLALVLGWGGLVGDGRGSKGGQNPHDGPSQTQLEQARCWPAAAQEPGPLREAEGEAEANAVGELARVVAAVVDGRLDVAWFVGVMARLHLNVFQVHNPLAGADPSDLAAAAAALVSGTAGGGSSGSAAYLLASLFNHSCEPSLELAFPDMDGAAAFVAARDVEPGEELCVSYLDVTLPYETRRRHLEWSYGFVCGCARCREEAAAAA